MVERKWKEQADISAIYFQEVGRTPLLTREEEIELAKQYDRGRSAEIKLKELEKNGLKPEEKEKLESLVAQGKEARERLMKANLRLVISIANHFQGLGMSSLDLIQEGNVGLMRAVDRFDPHRGTKFSTYATYWIRQAIKRALPDQGRTIRLPVHANEKRLQLKKKKIQLAREIGREPTQKELAEALGWKEEKVKEIEKITSRPLSLDKPIGENGNSYLGEFIEDEKASPPSEVAIRETLKEQLQEAIDTLTEREMRVLNLRFGLEDGISRTLEEVGREIGVTRERARQIQVQALRKLRHPSRSRGLKEYLR